MCWSVCRLPNLLSLSASPGRPSHPIFQALHPSLHVLRHLLPHHLIPPLLIPSPLLRYLLAWPIYWVLQGAILMGVWVLGHKCGHHAFSDYSWLDDTMGLILRKYDRFASDFDPDSPIFSERERLQVLVSDVGVFIVLYVLFKAMVARSLGWVVCVYGVPELMMGGFLVVVSYLHHTHHSLPHYDSEEWDWFKGC
ncbi:hypothetical protein AAC387_Pa12g0969 [Persea americana]